jgi:hypothetical protein
MSHIQTHGRADYSRLRIIPGDARSKAMSFNDRRALTPIAISALMIGILRYIPHLTNDCPIFGEDIEVGLLYS